MTTVTGVQPQTINISKPEGTTGSGKNQTQQMLGKYPASVGCALIVAFACGQSFQLHFISHATDNTTFSKNTPDTIIISSGAVGSFLGCQLMEKFGRIFTIRLTASFFTISSFANVLNTNISRTEYIISGVLTSIPSGMTSTVVMHYMVEVVPAIHRTFYAAMAYSLWHFGLLCGVVISEISKDSEEQMAAYASIAPTVALLLSFFLMVESPRWLLYRQKTQDAEQAHVILHKPSTTDSFPYDVVAEPKVSKSIINIVLSLTHLVTACILVIQLKYVPGILLTIDPYLKVMMLSALVAASSMAFGFFIGDKIQHRYLVLSSLGFLVFFLWITAGVFQTNSTQIEQTIHILVTVFTLIVESVYNPVILLFTATVYPMTYKTWQCGLPTATFFISYALLEVLFRFMINVRVMLVCCTVICGISGYLFFRAFPEPSRRTLENIHNQLKEKSGVKRKPSDRASMEAQRKKSTASTASRNVGPAEKSRFSRRISVATN